MSTVKEAILNGEAVLGIELGSTRIKAVLIDGSCKPVASGSYDWENQLENGIWTYALDEVWKGLQGSYAALKEDVKRKYGVTLTKLGAVGISAMMHGYLVFDKDGNQLVPFRHEELLFLPELLLFERADKLDLVFAEHDSIHFRCKSKKLFPDMRPIRLFFAPDSGILGKNDVNLWVKCQLCGSFYRLS